MSKLAEDHHRRLKLLLIQERLLPQSLPTVLREQLHIVIQYEAMRTIIEHAKPYCGNNHDRLRYAYWAKTVGRNAEEVEAILNLALLEKQGDSTTIESFREAIGWI